MHRRVANGLNMAAWSNRLVVVQIPGAMPLAMLHMALGQKTYGCFAIPGTALNMAFGRTGLSSFPFQGRCPLLC